MSRLPAAWASVALLLVGAVWAIWSIAGGIEFRGFQQQIHGGDTSTLNTTIVGQSFRSPQANLRRIEVELVGAIPQSPPGYVQVKLLEGDGLQGRALYEAPLSAARVISSAGASYLSVSFPAQGDSAGKTYTLAMVTPLYPINSAIPAGYSPVDALSSGRLYTAEGPQPGDLAITAYYGYSVPELVSDIVGAIGDRWLLVLAWLLWMALPGIAILVWLPNDLSPGQRLLAAPGLMALLWPLVLLYAGLVGFTFSTGRMWVLLALCALAIGIRIELSFRPRGHHSTFHIPHSTFRGADFLFWISFGLIMLVTLVTRLLSLRGLEAGVGMDAYHHTVISELFVRYGGIPHTFEPYAPLRSFTYHFGFHSQVAALSWLSGLKSPTDIMALMPQVGQVTGSVLPLPALALFAWKALGNRWIGLVAGGLAGLVSVLPAYFVEWSRYTEGQALAVMPVSWVLLLGALGGNAKWGMGNAESSRIYSVIARVGLAVVGAAGLFLTHYRIAVPYAGFVALYLAWRFVEAARQPGREGRFRHPLAEAGRVAIVAVCSLVVLLPWLINLQQNFVKNFIDTDVTGIDVYFATAERLGVSVLDHPSLPLLAVLSAVALAMLGWKETHNPRLGLAIGASAGLLGVASALYLFLNPTPVQMESDLQLLVLGLSPVTWVLLVEIVAFAALTWMAKRTGALLLVPPLAWLILALWSSPQLFTFRLPFVGYVDAVTLASAAWLPAVLLSGYAVVNVAMWVWRGMTTDDRRPTTIDRRPAAGASRVPALSSFVPSLRSGQALRPSSIAAVLVAVSLLVGLASGLSLAPVHDRQLYITPPDEEALLWMRDNLPRNSYVLANSFNFPWSPNQVLGLDSGLWAPYLAGVRSSVLSIAAYNEQPEDPRYFDSVLALLSQVPLSDDPAPWKALKAAGITHIYIGSRADDAGFSAQQLLLNKNVALVYHKDAVWLFRII